jgi:hypothetical protein
MANMRPTRPHPRWLSASRLRLVVGSAGLALGWDVGLSQPAEHEDSNHVAQTLRRWADPETQLSLVIHRTSHVVVGHATPPSITTSRYDRNRDGYSFVEWVGYAASPSALSLTHANLMIARIGTNYWALNPGMGVLLLRDNLPGVTFDENGSGEIQTMRNWHSVSQEVIHGCSPYVAWGGPLRLGYSGAARGESFCCGPVTVEQSAPQPDTWRILARLEQKAGEWTTTITRVGVGMLHFEYLYIPEGQGEPVPGATSRLLAVTARELPELDSGRVLLPGRVTKLFWMMTDLNGSSPSILSPSGVPLPMANGGAKGVGGPLASIVLGILAATTFLGMIRSRIGRPKAQHTTS